jgi:hypothetical protein
MAFIAGLWKIGKTLISARPVLCISESDCDKSRKKRGAKPVRYRRIWRECWCTAATKAAT